MKPKGEMGAKTIVHKAHSRSDSLRVTVPAKIVEDFGLKEGDVLDWAIEDVKGKKFLVVRRMVVG